MGKYILTSSVEDELWAIWELIAKDNPDAATCMVKAAHETFRRLALDPGLGRLKPFRSSRSSNVRWAQIPGFDSYLAFYREIPEGIQVLQMYDGAKDIERLFGA